VNEKDENTKIWHIESAADESREETGFGDTTTVEMDRDRLPGELPVALRARFEIIASDGRNDIIDLGDHEILIGRSPKCDIHIPFESVSRKHARVTFRNEEYFIEDLDSTNGLYVNGIKVEKCVLRNNDQIEIGGVKILFHEEKTLKKKDDIAE
jgi:pSer/pThr/pTyr-binding forkhead associated (FHA) protein